MYPLSRGNDFSPVFKYFTYFIQIALERSRTTLSKTDAILERQMSILKKKKPNLSKKRGLFGENEGGFNFVAAIEIGTSYSGYAYCESRDGKAVTHQHIGSVLIKYS